MKILEDIVRQYLPDYENRFKAEMGDLFQTDDSIAFDLQEQYFIQEHFPEALAARDKKLWEVVCKEQRKICALAVTKAKDFIAAAQDVHSAPTPIFNPELLKTE